MRTHDQFVSADVAANIIGIATEFAYLVDQGQAAESANLFAIDAKLVFGAGSPKPGTLDGIDAIRGYLVNRQSQTHVMTRHVITNFRMSRKADEQVEVQYMITLYRSEDGSRIASTAMVADTIDLCSQDHEGNWQIQHRTVTPFLTRG